MTVFHQHFGNLRVIQAVQGNAVLVTVAGEVDIGTVCLLEKGLAAARGRAWPPRVLVVDLRLVRFFGAAGVTALIQAGIGCQEQGVVLRIVANHRAVLRPLEIVGLIGALQPSPEFGQEWTRRWRTTPASQTVLDAATKVLMSDRLGSTTKPSSTQVE